MRRPRFTIAGLLGFVLFLAVGLAGLREATETWDAGVFGVTLAVLMTSVLLAVHRAGVRRAYWVGFALFGWAYLLLSLVPSAESRLPTSKVLAYLDSKVRARTITMTATLTGYTVTANPAAPQLTTITISPPNQSIGATQAGTVQIWDAVTGRLLSGTGGTTENFLRIGHSLLALLLAFLGAHLSRSLHASGHSRRAEEIESPPAIGAADD